VTDVDVLVVGAGPTGLALAATAHVYGARVRVIDRRAEQVHESRALAVQPRTLEVLRPFGVSDALVARGNPAVRLYLHGPGGEVSFPLFDRGMDDTPYPFLLFVSQAVTEEVLGEHLAGQGVTVERPVELLALANDGAAVTCTLGGAGGTTTRVRAAYVVGCDGARSTTRTLAGIDFRGGRYPQTFALADLSVDGLEPDAAHAFFGSDGIALFFPLVRPAPWRIITMRPRSGWPGAPPGQDTSLRDLQAAVDRFTGGRVRLHDPVWLSDFRLQHRQAATYRAGRVFVAGDAAHVHSPAGAQGMNTGIQDAVNLGWKLALVVRGLAPARLLDSYDAERRPVGATVVRYTDRAFTVATSTAAPARLARRMVPRLASLALRLPWARAYGFRTVGELDITYRRSPAVAEGHPRPRGGPRAGDRLPDASATVDGRRTTLHEVLSAHTFHLLLCGQTQQWDDEALSRLVAGYPGLLHVHRVNPTPRLGVRRPEQTAQYLVRPDGHVAYRAAGTDLAGLTRYLATWLSRGD
jgi:2-polyprenyl-6-methoxyphenol hydroxylase-like FAD-dependent oxidoreductase